MPQVHITVCLNEPIATINPNIYSHFMEHLGTCVDEGIGSAKIHRFRI